MKKLLTRVLLCALAVACLWFGSLLADRERLNEELIRFHVVANSDSANDQKLKLAVKDAVAESLYATVANAADVQEARAYIQDNLPEIQRIARETLSLLGCKEEVSVALCREPFPTRAYDSFSLPAGVYDTLRIVIGSGEGHNWWCVVFPTLCISASSETFADVAAGAGFPETLQDALSGEKEQELRFFLLDALGELEKSFFSP